jgi:hypothetical protein
MSELTNLSENEFIAKCLSDMMHGWIPLKTYLRMYPDETKRSVEGRVAKKIWQWRVHYFCPKGSQAWVNLPAIHLWASGLDSPDDNEREPVEPLPDDTFAKGFH